MLGRHFLNESSFWGESSCLACDLLFGCQPSCSEDIFLMSLLSGASLPVVFVICCLGVSWERIFIRSLRSGARIAVGLLICCLGVSLPVGKTFPQRVTFPGQVFLLGS